MATDRKHHVISLAHLKDAGDDFMNDVDGSSDIEPLEMHTQSLVSHKDDK